MRREWKPGRAYIGRDLAPQRRPQSDPVLTLQPCRTCHKPVAYAATKCPHCGQDTPIWTSGDTVLAVSKLVVGLAMFAGVTTCMVVAC